MNLDSNELPHVIVGACMEVHRHLGPGLVADAYKGCLGLELRMKELVVKQDQAVQVSYKDHWINCGFTLDFVIEDLIVVSVLAVEEFLPIHKDTMKNYLRLTGYETGMLINFNVKDMRSGVKRIIVSGSEPQMRYK
ncbi:MAG: GxxExxY protein [Verrucomicrobiales bacterium]|nr:GxxExxY protein [Verrucomicrobiae bacterium]